MVRVGWGLGIGLSYKFYMNPNFTKDVRSRYFFPEKKIPNPENPEKFFRLFRIFRIFRTFIFPDLEYSQKKLGNFYFYHIIHSFSKRHHLFSDTKTVRGKEQTGVQKSAGQSVNEPVIKDQSTFNQQVINHLF